MNSPADTQESCPKNKSLKTSMIGELIADRYRIIRHLDGGGVGDVFLAKQEALERHVAIKILRSEQNESPVALQRFEKEAKAISQIVHPHIVTLYDFGYTQDKKRYIALEFLQGVTLRQVINREKRLSAERSLKIISGIVKGLQEAHRHQIIHRDLKPENIMLIRSGEDEDFPKILDFGLALGIAEQERDNDGRLTQRHLIPGTPTYLTPERATGRDENASSDLYSLGVIWFELLTGSPPFKGENPFETIAMHIRNSPPKLVDIFPEIEVHPKIQELISKLLEKDPNNRPKSAADCLKELEHIQDSLLGKRYLTPNGTPLLRENLNGTPRQLHSEFSSRNFNSLLSFEDPPFNLTEKKIA